jgi:hypothetical protein
MIIDSNLKTQLEQLPHCPQGHALVQYLKLADEELKDIDTIKSWEETQGRKFARKVIKDLFYFMGEVKVETTSKNQYT